MPDMDGFETTAAIRAREMLTGGHVPIVAVTAYAMKGDRERCLAAGMDGYLSKPIQVRELLDLTRRIWRGHPSRLHLSLIPMSKRNIASVRRRRACGPACPLGSLGGDSQLLSELVEIYLCESPSLFVGGAEPYRRRMVELARVAHTIKGSVGDFSARVNPRRLAERLEEYAEQGDFANAQELWVRWSGKWSAWAGPQLHCVG